MFFFFKKKISFVVIIILTLQGCGFKPIYSYNLNEGNKGIIGLLQKIDVRPISDRTGIELRQFLRERINQGSSSKKEFDLQVNISTRIQEIGIRKDSTSSRANYIVTANIILWNGTIRMFRDTTSVTVSYNILDQQYATIASQKNAETRALRRISDNIRSMLSIYFSNRFQKN